MMKSYRLTLILSLCLWGLVNLWIVRLSSQQSLSLDLTDNQLYALSPVTESSLLTLEEETTVVVLARQEEFPSMLVEQLGRMALLTDKFTVDYQDVYENPLLLEQYRQKGYDLSPHDFLVVQGEYQRHIPFDEVLLYQGQNIVGIQLEQRLISGILSLTREPDAILFARGHNEMDDSALQTLFSQHYVQVNQGPLQDLSQYRMVVIASPKGDITLEEAVLLEEYCQNGGMLLVFFDAGVDTLPQLEGLLGRYGMEISPYVVLEEKAFLGNNPLNIMPMYEVHPITTYFQNNAVYTILPSAREILFNGQGNPSPLLRTTSDSYGTLDFSTSQEKESQRNGPFVVSAISQDDTGGGILVVSTGKAISTDILSSSAYANGLFFTQILNYVQDDLDFVQIPAKTMEQSPLVITGNQGLALALIYCILCPVAILLYGLIVLLKRKKL